MQYRKVFFSEETEESWSFMYDYQSGCGIQCWRNLTPDDADPVSSQVTCNSGCAAFRITDGNVVCLALPRGSEYPTIIGEIHPMPDQYR